MKYLFSLLLVTAVSTCFAQEPGSIFADSAFVFKGFSAGGSTTSLQYNSRMVDTLKYVTKVQLDAGSLDTLNYLMAQVKPNKHHQQKIGPGYYASIYKSGQEKRIALVPGWAILDLKNKQQYVFRNTPYAAIYERFIKRNYK